MNNVLFNNASESDIRSRSIKVEALEKLSDNVINFSAYRQEKTAERPVKSAF